MCEADQPPEPIPRDGSDNRVVPFPRFSRPQSIVRDASVDLLKQVATALGVAPDYFHRAASADVDEGDGDNRQQDQEALVRAFQAIRDPLMRRQLVKLVQALARGVNDEA